MPTDHFYNNSAHCAGLGLTIKGSHTASVTDVSLWRISHIALCGGGEWTPFKPQKQPASQPISHAASPGRRLEKRAHLG